MADIEGRVGTLELRIERLETWAGPGQVEVLTDGFRRLRVDVAGVRRVQDKHTRQLDGLTADVAELKTDVAELKTDVAELKTDVAELKSSVREILRRLPAEPPAG